MTQPPSYQKPHEIPRYPYFPQTQRHQKFPQTPRYQNCPQTQSYHKYPQTQPQRSTVQQNERFNNPLAIKNFNNRYPPPKRLKPLGSSGSMTSHPGGKSFNEDAYPQHRRFPAREDKYAVMRQNMLKKPPQQIAKSQPYNPATSNTPDKRLAATINKQTVN